MIIHKPSGAIKTLLCLSIPIRLTQQQWLNQIAGLHAKKNY